MIILNVDDDAEDREIFTEAIYEISPLIECIPASDGIEAQLLLAQRDTCPRFDYIFLDINMPKMNGIALLEAIKKDKRLKQIPVYMLSTTSNEKEIDKIRSLGGKFVQKQGEFGKTVNMLSSILYPHEGNLLNKKLGQPIIAR